MCGVRQSRIGDEIVALLRLPFAVQTIRSHHQDANCLWPPVAREMLQCKKMLVPLGTEADAAPVWAGYGDLMQQRIEARGRLANAGVSRDQPVARKLPGQPFQVLVLHDVVRKW